MTNTFSEFHDIPKIIHQSYLRTALTDVLERNIAEIKNINPGWTYRFYDDADCRDFIEGNYGPQLVDAYNQINPIYGAARADLFRYMVIYKTGGVWLDIKSTMTKPLDATLKAGDVFILSQWQNKMGEAHQGWGLHRELRALPGGEFQQWHIISAPRNPFIKAVLQLVFENIKYYTEDRFGTGKPGVVRTTGPVPYTIAIAKRLKKHPYRLVDAAKDLGFVYSVYDGSLDHRQTLHNHYSKHDAPVILPREMEYGSGEVTMAK